MDLTKEQSGHYRWLIGSLLEDVPSDTVVFAPLDGKIGGYTAQEFLDALEENGDSYVRGIACDWASGMMRAVRDMLIRRAERDGR